MAKGSDWERKVSKILSLWWTDNERDDVFWRDKSSGGRATTRGKTGKTTACQCGDIVALDPVGAPLVGTLVMELKKGYKNWSVMDIIESRGDKPQWFEKFMLQVYGAVEDDGGGKFAVLILSKDYKRPVIAIDTVLFNELCKFKTIPKRVPIAQIRKELNGFGIKRMTIMAFNDFLEWCRPDWIRSMERPHNKKFKRKER